MLSRTKLLLVVLFAFIFSTSLKANIYFVNNQDDYSWLTNLVRYDSDSYGNLKKF